MLIPSGSAWMTSTSAPVAARISGPDADSPSRWRSRARSAGPRAGISRARPIAVRAVVVEQLAGRRPPGRSGRCATPPSSSVRQISCSSSSSIGVVELEPGAVEDLEPVVVGRVVRGGDHDPGRERATTGQEGEGRRRDDPDEVDVDAQARRAGGDGRHEHVARPARVLADDDRAAATRPADGRPRGPSA